MSTDPRGGSPVEQAFATGTRQRVGWYRFYFADERWEWSPEVEQIHGYQPGTVDPTTRLVLSHKHPDDHEYVAATLADIRQTRKPFSTRHRIITVQGDTRDVVVLGQQVRQQRRRNRQRGVLHRRNAVGSIKPSNDHRSPHRNR